jgi:hypothetical protein
MTINPVGGPEPPYCAGRNPLSTPLTPGQWATCWRYGWDQPTTTLAHMSHDFGHAVLPALIVIAIIFLMVRIAISR